MTRFDDPADAYDPATRAFDGMGLHWFMVQNQWTVPRLAEHTRLGERTVRRALHGRPIQDRSAGLIIDAVRSPWRRPASGTTTTSSPAA